jgi:hypothetical protein
MSRWGPLGRPPSFAAIFPPFHDAAPDVRHRSRVSARGLTGAIRMGNDGHQARAPLERLQRPPERRDRVTGRDRTDELQQDTAPIVPQRGDLHPPRATNRVNPEDLGDPAADGIVNPDAVERREEACRRSDRFIYSRCDACGISRPRSRSICVKGVADSRWLRIVWHLSNPPGPQEGPTGQRTRRRHGVPACWRLAPPRQHFA